MDRLVCILKVSFYPNIVNKSCVQEKAIMFIFSVFLPGFKSRYQSSLTENSYIFSRPNGHETQYHFEAIVVTASMTGTYMIIADSVFDTYGCLYHEPFYSNNPLMNLIKTDDDNGPELNFQFTMNLTTNQSVILVVTTFTALKTAQFDITVYGPAQVFLKGKIHPELRILTV